MNNTYQHCSSVKSQQFTVSITFFMIKYILCGFYHKISQSRSNYKILLSLLSELLEHCKHKCNQTYMYLLFKHLCMQTQYSYLWPQILSSSDLDNRQILHIIKSDLSFKGIRILKTTYNSKTANCNFSNSCRTKQYASLYPIVVVCV